MAKTVSELSIEVENLKKMHETCQKRLNTNLEKLFDKNDELLETVSNDRRETDKQLAGRPARIDAYTIALLTSLVVGLLVRMVS